MNSIYRFFLIIGLLFTTISWPTCKVFCQTNFQPGEIVTIDGKRVVGFVNDELWKENPFYIEFRDDQGTEGRFEPEDILEFKVSGLIYKSVKVKYDSSSYKISSLSTTFSANYKTSHIFLRMVMQGDPYNLLELITFDDRHHYFIQNNNEVEELINHKYVVPQTGVVKVNKMYIGQLRNFFRDCSTIIVDDNFPYTKLSFIEVFKQYYTCRGTTPVLVDQLKIPTYKIKFGLVGKATFDRFDKFWGWGFGFGYGAFLEFNAPSRLYKNSFLLEIATHAYRKQEQDYMVSPFPQKFHQSINPLSVKLLFGYRTRILESKYQPYFTAGAGFQANQINVTGVPSGAPASIAPRGPSIVGFIGTGTRIKIFTPEFRMEAGAAGYISFQITTGIILDSTN